MSLRSRRIGRAFESARDYDAHATAQAASAARLAELAAARGIAPGARVLDAGCGTGALAERLLGTGRVGVYLCADIAPAMLARARARLALSPAPALNPAQTPFPAPASTPASAPTRASAPPIAQIPAPLLACMDLAAPALKGRFHLVASNMALHWVPDIPAALAGLWELVAPGGLLAVSIPGEETFAPWRRAHQALGLPCGLQDFPSAATFAAMFPAIPEIVEECYPLPPGPAIALPRHLKSVGGFVPRPGHAPLPPALFRRVLRLLDAEGDGARMGYHVLHALAAKPA